MVAWQRTFSGIVNTLLVGVRLAVSVGLAVCVGGGLIFSSPVSAQERQPQSALSQPAMPLGEALRRFAKASRYDVVFQEELVRGRRSAAVVGPGSPHDALVQMLAGSGLTARFTRPDALILERQSAADAPDLALQRIDVVAPVPAERQAQYRWYGEKLLQASLKTLRQSREMGMRSYDFTIYVWLSAEGTVVDLEGHDGAGQNEVLGIAKAMLKGLIVGIVPPVDMPQPVGLRITAQ